MSSAGVSPSSPLTPPQTCQVGLNFASEEEARRFRAAISDLLNRRQRKTGEKVPPPTHLPHLLLILLISCSTPTLFLVRSPVSSLKSRPSSGTPSWKSALCDVTKGMTRPPGSIATPPWQSVGSTRETPLISVLLQHHNSSIFVSRLQTLG